MGQYHVVANIDRQEFIHPHQIGCGLKFLEQVFTMPGTPQALFMLLGAQVADGRRGGGDPAEHDMIGRWAGDRIVVAGDYDEAGDPAGVGVWNACMGDEATWTNITSQVAELLEREFDGRYTGDGWRDFEPNTQDSMAV